MFEDSLMESQNRLSSPNQRWTAVLSLTFQCALVAAVVAIPLLHPEALPFRVDAPRITLPPKPLPPPTPHVAAAATASTSASVPAPSYSTAGPRLTLTTIPNSLDVPPTISLTGNEMGDPYKGANTIAIASTGSGPRIGVVPVSPASRGPLHISTGVSAGLLLAPITPVYPRIAISARVEGAVRVGAIISKGGRIESAQVVAGPEMLRQAALDAIRNAHYTPYLLNGSPTEVETTITVNFKLSS